MAEVFNEHFTSIGQHLAQDIPHIDITPESYLEPTDKTFSLQAPSVNIVCTLLKNINEESDGTR